MARQRKPTRVQSQVSHLTPLTGPTDLFFSALPPLIKAVKVLFSTDPLQAAEQERQPWHSIFVALGLSMAFAMLVIHDPRVFELSLADGREFRKRCRPYQLLL